LLSFVYCGNVVIKATLCLNDAACLFIILYFVYLCNCK
jgi:hypothetical protein